MTLELTTRPFTAEEAAYLASWRPPRFGFSVAAAWLLIVPVVVAGIVSFTMILAGVSLGATLAISYAVGLAFGLFALSRQYKFFRHSLERAISPRTGEPAKTARCPQSVSPRAERGTWKDSETLGQATCSTPAPSGACT